MSAQRLKAVHAACHPGAANTPRRTASVDTTGDDELAAHLDAWLAAELDEELDHDTQDVDG